jgi:hypothetical protein
MKWKFVLVIVGLCLAFCVGKGQADVILPSTGAAGVGVDHNYTVSYSTSSSIPGSVTWSPYAHYVGTPSIWVTPPEGALWIRPTGPDWVDDPFGWYWYSLKVQVPGVISISGRWAMDNMGEIFLNGTSTGVTKDEYGHWGFLTLDSFTITGDFTGDDTLVFRVYNAGGPSGLLVTDLTAELVPLEANVNIDPDTLNLKSSGEWITAYIEPPDGYDVQNIDIDSIRLEGLLDVQESEIQGSVLMVKFDREAVVVYLEDILQVAPPADVTLTVTGELGDGTEFTGDDTIRVISPAEKM